MYKFYKRIKMPYCWHSPRCGDLCHASSFKNIFHYSEIKMVAVTLVVTVSLMWHMQWTKKRLLLVFSDNSLQSNLRFGLPSSIIPLNSAVNSSVWGFEFGIHALKSRKDQKLKSWLDGLHNPKRAQLNAKYNHRREKLWNVEFKNILGLRNIRLLSLPVLTELDRTPSQFLPLVTFLEHKNAQLASLWFIISKNILGDFNFGQ